MKAQILPSRGHNYGKKWTLSQISAQFGAGPPYFSQSCDIIYEALTNKPLKRRENRAERGLIRGNLPTRRLSFATAVATGLLLAGVEQPVHLGLNPAHGLFGVLVLNLSGQAAEDLG